MAFLKLTSPNGNETTINTNQITYLTNFDHKAKNQELTREFEDNKRQWENHYGTEPNEAGFKQMKKAFESASTNVYLENKSCRYVRETQEEIRLLTANVF